MISAACFRFPTEPSNCGRRAAMKAVFAHRATQSSIARVSTVGPRHVTWATLSPEARYWLAINSVCWTPPTTARLGWKTKTCEINDDSETMTKASTQTEQPLKWTRPRSKVTVTRFCKQWQ